jgi:hypothetical protein
VEVILPGFKPWTTEIEIQNRLFASRFFPLKNKLYAVLEAEDPAAAFVREAEEFAAWTLAGEPTVSWQTPLTLSEGAYRLAFSADEETGEAMKKTLAASVRFGTTRASLKDIIRAKFLLDNGGLSPSPLGLLDSAGDILTFLDENPGASAWLAGVLQTADANVKSGGDASSLVKESAWYKKETERAQSLAGTKRPPLLGNSVSVQNLVFREIPGGKAVLTGTFPHENEVQTFLIAETEITRELWERFLEEEPKWKSENIDALVRDGLVTGDYLTPVDLPGSPSFETIPSVSWYAAGAFCQWFSSLLPASFSGWEIRLPFEAEWEYAVGAMPDMIGGYWEWCADSFAPLDFFPVEAVFVSPEKAVRGGSWLNPAGSISPETRGSLPPETCSVFVSFRPVLAPR